MVENTQNSFERYIDLFTFYIILINYAIFTNQILIFWTQLGPKHNYLYFIYIHFTSKQMTRFLSISIMESFVFSPSAGEKLYNRMDGFTFTH